MKYFLTIIAFLCAVGLTSFASADDFGARWMSKAPSAMDDRAPSIIFKDIEPAAGAENASPENPEEYLKSLFGQDMGSNDSVTRKRVDNNDKSPIVRIYAKPL